MSQARLRWRGRLLAGAGLVALTVAAAAGFEGREDLLESQRLVTHTNDVKLELAAARLALARGDRVALHAAEQNLERLTVDNTRQQRAVARAALLTEQDANTALDAVLVTMDHEESLLMDTREDRLIAAERRHALASGLAFVLTIALLAAASASQRKRRAELAHQRRLIEAVVEKVDEGIVAVSATGETIAFNAALRAMLGSRIPARIDRPAETWSNYIRLLREDGTELKSAEAPLARALRGETTTDFVYRVVARDDPDPTNATWLSSSARPVRDENGDLVAAVSTVRDVTAQRAATARLHELSIRDEMTGLLNRRGFIERSKVEIATAKARRTPVAVLFADLNGLKRINDELGHEEGDRAIKDTADALRASLRDSALVARLGGDEFVALLPGLDPADAEPFVERLSQATTQTGKDRARTYRLSLSAGVSFMDWTRDDQAIEEVLVEADQRMYTRKRAPVSSSFLRLVGT